MVIFCRTNGVHKLRAQLLYREDSLLNAAGKADRSEWEEAE